MNPKQNLHEVGTDNTNLRVEKQVKKWEKEKEWFQVDTVVEE